MHFVQRSLFALILLAALTGCATQAAAPAPTVSASTVAPTVAAPPTSAPIAAPTAAPQASIAAPQRPFPQHSVYTAGTIKPNRQTQAKLDAAVLTAYRAWKRAYLKSGCRAGRFYVDPGQDAGSGKSPRGISISEGHGYGMLMTAFMAGVDPDAKQIFDGLYAFFRDHPSTGGPDLMAWKQVEGCQNLDPTGTGSATDGDMDIAYALLLADRQWGSGAIDYHRQALKVIGALKDKVVNPRTNTILLGDWVKAGDTKYYNGKPGVAERRMGSDRH